MMRLTAVFALLATSACALTPAASPSSTPAARSSTTIPAPGLSRGIATADSLVTAAIGRLTPGAVLLVSKDGRIVHDAAFGYAQLHDYEGRRLASPPPMTTSTMFDLASVTKVMGTTMGIMRLVD